MRLADEQARVLSAPLAARELGTIAAEFIHVGDFTVAEQELLLLEFARSVAALTLRSAVAQHALPLPFGTRVC